MINLAFSGFLAGLLALAVPILLHFLKKRPTQPTPFPSLRFLKPTLAKRAANNTLRKWLILLLRCLCLLALILAFCRPYLPRFAKEPETATVILWDHSFSMQAQPHKENLRNLCIRQLNQANAENPMLLGLVTDDVDWSGSFTADPDELKTFFALNPVSEQSSAFEQALRQADLQLATIAAKQKQIVLITDHQGVPWQKLRFNTPLSPGVSLQLITPPEHTIINAAIASATLQTPYTGPNGRIALETELTNHSTTHLAGKLITLLDDEPLDQRPVSLPPNSTITEQITGTGELKRHGLQLILEVEDHLNEDNVRWLALNAAPNPTILADAFPSEEIDFIRLAFQPTPETEAAQWVEIESETLRENLPQANLLLLRNGTRLNTAEIDQVLEYIRAGGAAAITWNNTPGMRNLLLQLGVAANLIPEQKSRELDFIDFDHPIFKPFLETRLGDLYNILFHAPPTLSLPDHAQVLARFSNGSPALAELSVEQGRILLFSAGMDREQTDWPTHASFLPLWRETLDYLQTGTPLPTDHSTSAHPLHVTDLKTARNFTTKQPIPLMDGCLPVRSAGNVLLFTDTEARLISINPPAEESDPAPWPERPDWQQLVSTESPTERPELLQPIDEASALWYPLLLIATLAALGELALANRTVL